MTASGPEQWVNPAVRALTAYHVADATGLVKLDAMENPYTWPAALTSTWLDRLRHAAINRYPDPEATRLKERVREFLGIPDDAPLLLGNGSDELLQMIAIALCGPGRTILAPEPTFAMYRIVAEVLNFRFAGVPLRGDDFGIDPATMVEAIARHRPAIVFLANPNNPTGNLFEPAAVEAVLAAAPGLVVVDEAYYPFAGKSWLPRIGAYPNLVVMQTLSKAGLAGLRVGMLAGSGRWLDEINKVRLPYNINVLSQLSAGFILEHADFLREQARQICLDRDRLAVELAAIEGVRVWPSHANFLLFRTPRDAGAVHGALRARGVLIKRLDGSHPLLAGCLRVTVGTAGDNGAFLDALRATLA
jgi:histidinol-phosphate aminotransferase